MLVYLVFKIKSGGDVIVVHTLGEPFFGVFHYTTPDLTPCDFFIGVLCILALT